MPLGGIRFVGQAPSRRAGRRRAFEGSASGRMLASLMGMSPQAWLEQCSTTNLMRRWPGPPRKGTKGDAFPLRLARRAARRFRFSAGDVHVLVGRQVARAFGHEDKAYFHWFVVYRDDGYGHAVAHYAVVVPHPSGANHWWNSWQNRERAVRFFDQLARWQRWYRQDVRQRSRERFRRGVGFFTTCRLDEFGTAPAPVPLEIFEVQHRAMTERTFKDGLSQHLGDGKVFRLDTDMAKP